MDIYQHFRKEEHEFIDKVLSWKDDVERSFQRKLSDFLDPREQKIFSSIIGKQEELKWDLSGGGATAERKRAILAPFYEEIEQKDYQITLLEASYPDKFITLEHRDVLGAFLSMGIKRKKLGDLIVQNGTIHIVVASDIETYVKLNLKEVKKAKVSFEEIPLANLMVNEEKWESTSMTVSSLRLDAVMKEIYRMSRQSASSYIQKGLVKVNFKTVDNSSFQLEETDLISVRGKGRSKLITVDGTTKKEKVRITVEKLK